jgi:hypothetical protein
MSPVAPARLAHDALDAALGLLEVGVDELGLDRLDVAHRVDRSLRVQDRVVVMGADDVHDRVGLADVGQELVAEPLALAGAGHQPSDVMERDAVPHDLRRPDGVGDPLEPGIADRHDGDVRLDRGERVVRCLGARLGERVEERRLACVGHADDADLHRASSAAALPSSAPATTSEG